MRYLLDSDAAKKLCQYCLVQEFFDCLGVPPNEVAVLPQLKFQLHANNEARAIRKLGTAEAVVQLQFLLASTSEVDVGPEAAQLALLLARPDVDIGEQVLFSALATQAETELVTGDKRALAALSEIDGSEEINACWPRILCFDQVLRLLLENGPFDHIAAKVRAQPEVDIAASISFGRSAPNPIETVVEGLNSYIQDLYVLTRQRLVLR